MLIVTLEHMVGEDRDSIYERFASFMGFKGDYADTKLLPRVAKTGRIGYMVTHIEKFQNKWVREKQKKKKFG